MYKKFDKSCEPYPFINTTDFNDTPHKGVDRPDGLVYKQSKSGRETGSQTGHSQHKTDESSMQ